MALVSGGRSTLNPNAPLFIPAALRQVEDFSPEWWELVTTSTWFHDYWLRQQQEEDSFYGNDGGIDDNDIANLLPDTIDLLTDEDDFSSMEAHFEEFISENAEADQFPYSAMKGTENGSAIDAEALMRTLSLSRSGRERGAKGQVESAKFANKPAKRVSPKCSPRPIQQPR